MAETGQTYVLRSIGEGGPLDKRLEGSLRNGVLSMKLDRYATQMADEIR
jgi:hypothetical protein